MKKINIAITFIALLLSVSANAKENNVVGSGTITFVGAIVDGGCLTKLDKNNFKTSCWNGEEMKETSYHLEPNKKISSNLNKNKGSMNIKWINDKLAIVNISYN